MLKVLMLVVLSQTAHPEVKRDFRPAIDMVFAEEQERWIYETHTVHFLDDVLPKKVSRTLLRLGCVHYDCRIDAEKDLRNLKDYRLRACFWGTKLKKDGNVSGPRSDLEVRLRSERLLNELYKCPNCKGKGKCIKCTVTVRHFCPVCHGSGDLRFLGVENYDQYIGTYVERHPRDLLRIRGVFK